MSAEDGATVLSVPLSGELAGVTLKATLDSKNFITKVVAQTGGGMDIEADYSDYADHGEILTDIKSPGHIIKSRAARQCWISRSRAGTLTIPIWYFPFLRM